ncbi:MAG: CinA family protein [Chlamydiae bacterium]|nr:CinA family protein [Chlamydiota bacterium]
MKKIEQKIHEWMVANHKTLCIAESCTGGHLAAHLTAIAGASQYFLGSFVAYSNTFKNKILSISQEKIDQFGPVSQEIVREMAKRAFEKTGADIVLAVTGIAGPEGGTEEIPVGLVWMAIGIKGSEMRVWKCQFKGSRLVIINKIIDEILYKLYGFFN